MTFGEKIAAIRKSAGLSQEQFGEMFGVSRQSVSKWESDQTLPELATMIKIADLFDVSIDYLLGRQQKENDDTKHTFEKTISGNMKFRLGILTTVVGVILLSVTMAVDYIGIRHWGDPLRMLITVGNPTQWLWYITMILLIAGGIVICWKTIKSNE